MKGRKASIDVLRQAFVYDPERGTLIWKLRPPSHFKCSQAAGAWNTKYAGSVAGAVNKDGYIQLNLGDKTFLAHRLIWALVHGQWPPDQIDHIDGDRQNNKLSNLRTATPLENQRNLKRHRGNSSGFTGVQYRPLHNKPWSARISVRGELKYLGSFRCVTAAWVERERANRRYGFHSNHGLARLDAQEGSGGE